MRHERRERERERERERDKKRERAKKKSYIRNLSYVMSLLLFFLSLVEEKSLVFVYDHVVFTVCVCVCVCVYVYICVCPRVCVSIIQLIYSFYPNILLAAA